MAVFIKAATKEELEQAPEMSRNSTTDNHLVKRSVSGNAQDHSDLQ